jgi:hypothetical protein
VGASASQNGLSSPTEPKVSALTGFDPSRIWAWLIEPTYIWDYRVIGWSLLFALASFLTVLVIA